MSIDISNFKDFNIPISITDTSDEKANISNNKLERSPSQDEIKLSSINKDTNKYKLLALATSLIGIGTTTFAIVKGKKLSKISQELAQNKSKINDLAHDLEKSKEKIAKLNSNEEELTKLKEFLKEIDVSTPQGKVLVKKEYTKILEELNIAKLNYDPLQPPLVADIIDKLKFCKSVYKASEISPFNKTQQIIDEVIDVDKLKKEFTQNNVLEIELPMTDKVKIAVSDTALIKNKEIENLDEFTNTDFMLNYGKNVGWSDEKIARDILQNFYDGHGNTLDGVKIKFEKLPTGDTKIKVSGNAIFDHECLQFLGSGTKKENPYNAGGFGEGSKVLVANLIGSNKTNSVKFTSADWQLEFKGKDGILQRKISKVDSQIDGNTIEFTTKDDGVVKSLIDATNYFKHSKNPDFKTTSFACDEFSFDILPPNSKGNVYLTQRFEFNKNGAWDNAFEGLNISFNRKPDLEKFKEITGEDFSQVRDRTCLNLSDIENLTTYFAHENMSDEDLVRAILSTKEHWKKLDPNKETGIRSFIKGLLNEARTRNVGVNFDNQKVACFNYNTNEIIQKKLYEYGYTIVPEEFSNIKMKSANDVFKEMSLHTPLNPNETEIKKFKLLEEATECVQKNIKTELRKTLSDPQIHFNNDFDSTNLIFKSLITNHRHDKEVGNIFYNTNMDEMSKETFEKLKKRLEFLISENLKNLTNENDLKKISEYAKGLIKEEIFDIKTVEQAKKINDFCIITDEDIKKPRYIFDRHSEIKTNTLGEAIIEKDGSYNRNYIGHWVDREYLENADFNDALATWLHEICHKSGGDGQANFTYALTDLIKVLLSTDNKTNIIKLEALKKAYENL